MNGLLPEGKNCVVSATALPVELASVDASDIVSGAPEQGTVELGSVGRAELGIWELRGGTVTDTEVDECFIVLSGSATIEFLDDLDADERPRSVSVGAGDIMRLVAGSRTRWTVADHIRKVYLTTG